VNSYVCEISLEFKIAALFNPNVRMARSVADGIPRKFDRHLARITDERSFPLEKCMASVRSYENKDLPVTEVLEVCKTGGLSSRSGSFSNPNPILRNHFRIYSEWVFLERNFSANVEEIPTPHVGDRELLNESSDARRLTAILH
jgi:hypothetical protein